MKEDVGERCDKAGLMFTTFVDNVLRNVGKQTNKINTFADTLVVNAVRRTYCC